MAYVIKPSCIECGACLNECPVECISPSTGAFKIRADYCIECGACANICPVDAPVQE
jgi:ferredoxin